MGCEGATKGAQEIVKVEPDRDKAAEEVHVLAKWSTDERTGKCFWCTCGRRNHTAGQCPHIESVCYNCGKKGHILRYVLTAYRCHRHVHGSPPILGPGNYLYIQASWSR